MWLELSTCLPNLFLLLPGQTGCIISASFTVMWSHVLSSNWWNEHNSDISRFQTWPMRISHMRSFNLLLHLQVGRRELWETQRRRNPQDRRSLGPWNIEGGLTKKHHVELLYKQEINFVVSIEIWGLLGQLPVLMSPGSSCTHPSYGSMRYPSILPINSLFAQLSLNWVSFIYNFKSSEEHN